MPTAKMLYSEIAYNITYFQYISFLLISEIKPLKLITPRKVHNEFKKNEHNY